MQDSPEWKALTPAAHDVILMAFRRYDGTNRRRIAVTPNDFEGRPGFAKKDTFYNAREAVLRSGILLFASKGRNTQTGRTPDLFEIPAKWLREHSASPEIVTLRQSRKGDPYIDKQSLVSVAAAVSDAQTKTGKAA